MASATLEHAAEQATTGHEMVQEMYYQDPKFWVAVGFAIFIALAAKYIWPAIARGLDSRAAKIREQLEQAAKLKAEAEALLAQYKKEQKKALKDAEEILENAKKDAKLIRDNAAKELKASLERRAQQAEDNIARAEAQALNQLRTHLIDVATEATRSVVAKQLAGQKDDPAIDRALAAIERQIH